MRRNEFGELCAFAAIMEAGSFTRAAARLGVSPSTLSQTIRSLEERLGTRLFNRTTRSVAPTRAGNALFERLAPALRDLDTAVAAVRDVPAGPLRLNLSRIAADLLVAPMLAPFLSAHPQIQVELAVDDSFVDIVAGGFDAGIRLGDLVPKDMVAVRLGPELRLAVVAAPAYLAAHGRPVAPSDLCGHRCTTWRGLAGGELWRWEFHKDGEDLRIGVDGALVVNDFRVALRVARDGGVIACLLEDLVAPHIASGELVPLLEDWWAGFPGFHLYHPSRRLVPPPLRAFIDFARASRPPGS